MRSRSEILESVEKHKLVTYFHRHPDDYSASAACAASLGTPRGRCQPFKSESPCYSDDLPGTANKQGAAEVNSLND